MIKSYSIGLIFQIITSKINFTNILPAAHTHADPESAKKAGNLTVFLYFQDLQV